MRLQKILTVLILGAAYLAIAPSAEAAQHTVVGPDGKTHIVHDQLGPVLMHRVFPPYKGIHVHSNEMQRMQANGRRR